MCVFIIFNGFRDRTKGGKTTTGFFFFAFLNGTDTLGLDYGARELYKKATGKKKDLDFYSVF